MLAHHEKVTEGSKRALQSEPNVSFANVILAISCIGLGREEEARAAAAEVWRTNSKFYLDRYAKKSPFTQPPVERNIEDLRKAELK